MAGGGVAAHGATGSAVTPELDIHEAMQTLAVDRPLFHSEADFQHALAWCLQRSDEGRSLRLETRAPLAETIYIDIVATNRDASRVAIELKYWTKRLDVDVNDEPFRLRNQGAHDISRYDFVKDVARVERLVRAGVADSGWVIALTNDRNYWSPASRADTIDAAFRLAEGRTLSGRLSWADHAGAGTTRNRLDPHELDGVYEVRWRDYSEVDSSSAGSFRYLAIHVPA